jgi:signal transduction histidine kinase
VLWALGPPLLPLIALLFPDGRPCPPLGRWAAAPAVAGIAVVALLSALAPGPLAGFSSHPGPRNPLGMDVLAPPLPALAAAAVVLEVAAALLGLLSLVLRWRRGEAGERLGLAAAGTPLAAAISLYLAALVTGLDALAVAGTLVAAIGIPAGIWVAVTRHRLYELDLPIAKALAFALLAVGLVVVFLLTGAGVELLSGGRSSLVVGTAAAVTALAFPAARRRITVAVQRAVVGPAGDPARATAAVGARLAAVRDPDAIPASVVSAVSDVLGVPVQLLLPGRPAPGGAHVTHGLAQHGVELGTLVVQASVTAAGRRSLAAIAVPVAAALYAASLSEKVRRSRAELVAAVEEERRRLRRDLHDGLGPRLATLAMGLDAARNRATDGAASPELTATLSRLREQTDQMLHSLRQIVSELRPPALDDLGLSGALQRYAEEVALPQGFCVEIVADQLDPLPAAVEVAAYRIAAEALLNAVRHSGGSHCRLSLTGTGIPGQCGLSVEVTDDGAGSPGAPAGVGTHSMRERAAAVGGWVTATPTDGGGTSVHAWLPTVAA